jgi:hypothetical protein
VFIPLLFLARFQAGLEQLCLLRYEVAPEHYEQPFNSHPWTLKLQILLGAFPLVQFSLGVLTITGLLFLFDIRTRRSGLWMALPPLLLEAISWSNVGYLPLIVLPWAFFLWILWLSLRRRASFGPAEQKFYGTPAVHNISRFWTALLVIVIATSGIARMLILRPSDNGARSLAGTRTVNHRGVWTYQPSRSVPGTIDNSPFDLYFWPYGLCHSVQNGVKFEGRLLSQYYGRDIHLDCLPQYARLYAKFEITGDRLSIENRKGDPPFRLEFIKKDWGPGWYDDFLPFFRTK